MGLFSRKPKPPTGHPLDEQLLGIIATTAGGTSAAREWTHFVYCETDDGAAALESAATLAGWDVARVAMGSGIVASRTDLAVSAESVREQRAFFEGLAARVSRGEYDGWEAAV